MKTLKEIFDELYIESLVPVRGTNGTLKAYCDKNTSHCYVDYLYENLFKDVRTSTTKLLEIGIYGGGSMMLWRDYFPNAHIYGVDLSYYISEFAFDDRMTQIIGDAYSPAVVSMFADNTFDIVIDDGPHTLESFTLFAQNYWSKVAAGGYFIIEDIYDPAIVPSLLSHIPSEEISSAELCDFRHVKNLFDDTVLVVKKKN